MEITLMRTLASAGAYFSRLVVVMLFRVAELLGAFVMLLLLPF